MIQSDGFLSHSSQTRTGVSQPRLFTGRFDCEQMSQTPYPHDRQWWMGSFSVKGPPQTQHLLISWSGIQYSGRAKSFIHAAIMFRILV